MSKHYTIQIIPEGSNEIKKLRVSSAWFTVIKVVLIIFVLFMGAFIYNLSGMALTMAKYEKLKLTDAQLVKTNKNYEDLFSRIDSIWVLESRIQNILQTYMENDSAKINSIIDKNQFAHTPSEKINVDFEGLHGWQPMEEKIRLEHIPNIIPVVGIVSKKFSEESEHTGTDISAPAGNPVFASASGVVEFAGQKDELGNTVIIDHKNGYKTTYAHMKDIKTRKNHQVQKGDIIGSVGNTGKTTSGPHLHYGVTSNGNNLDPETLFNY